MDKPLTLDFPRSHDAFEAEIPTTLSSCSVVPPQMRNILDTIRKDRGLLAFIIDERPTKDQVWRGPGRDYGSGLKKKLPKVRMHVQEKKSSEGLPLQTEWEASLMTRAIIEDRSHYHDIKHVPNDKMMDDETFYYLVTNNMGYTSETLQERYADYTRRMMSIYFRRRDNYDDIPSGNTTPNSLYTDPSKRAPVNRAAAEGLTALSEE